MARLRRRLKRRRADAPICLHALIFSQVAVWLESDLHQTFVDRRVNLVDRRREFFHATPTEVREALGILGGPGQGCASPGRELSGGPRWNRTNDLGIKSPLLYQLS